MPKRTHFLALLVFAMLGVACAPQPTFPATPTKTPNPSLAQAQVATRSSPIPATRPVLPSPTADPPTPTAIPTTETAPITPHTPSITGTPTITAIPPTFDPSLPPDHYFMFRPIQEGGTDYADRTYAYGSTSGGKYRPHTGEEFRNPASTPVVAVSNATVQYAGSDQDVLYGPQPNFYGNLIVLQMSDFTYEGQPVFALYGHLSEIYVQTGQTVATRDVIGAVGSTGVAIGPHLHFEVRVGDPTSYFTSTRNPDLWIKPYYGYGTLAGRVVDGSGNLLREVALTVVGADMTRYTWTYAGDENIPDEQWKENFTLGDLPEGWYTVTTRSANRTYKADIYIANGRTTWLEFVFN